MPTTPAGSVMLSAEYAAATLADCPAFRTWCGADDATQARGRIHLEALPPPSNKEEFTLDELKAHRPYVILNVLRFAQQHVATGNGFDFSPEGTIELFFEQDILAEIAHNTAEIATRFYNAVGAIIDELCSRAGLAGFLAFTSVRMDQPCSRTHPDAVSVEGDALMIRLALDWSSG